MSNINLEQLISKKNVVGATYKREYANVSNVFSQDTFFQGSVKTYMPLTETEDDETSYDIPDNVYQKMKYELNDLVDKIQTCFTQYLNCATTIDKTNASGDAKAELYINDVSYGIFSSLELMTLETELAKIKLLVSQVPTLDISKNWKQCQDSNKGVYTSDTITNNRTVTETDFVVVVKPTEHQPAIVKDVSRKKTVGMYQTTYSSSAMIECRKNEILKKLDDVIIAVRKARHEANKATCQKNDVSNIIGYIFA